MTQPPRNSGGEGQPERWKSDYDLRIKGCEFDGKSLGDRVLHSKARLIDNKRSERMLTVRKGSDRQQDLVAVMKPRREIGPCSSPET